MTRITYVLGTTCVGKSTLIEKAAELYPHDVHIIQVGKELRKRHPPGYFEGKGAMDHTEHEVEEIFTEGVHAGLQQGKCEILVDGNPRSMEQCYLLDKFPGEDKRFWWVDAPAELVAAWLDERFAEDTASRDLAQQRIINDRVQLYPLIFWLHDMGARPIYVEMGEGFDYARFFKEQQL